MSIRAPRNPILVVEDDDLMIEVFKDIFSIHRLEFEIAKNGNIGLQLSKTKEYSIYITDLNMPLMGGKEFIKELKKIKKDPIVLVQTGVLDPETIIEIMKLGIFDYIIKPFDIDLFQIILRKALEFKYAKEQEAIQITLASEKLRSQIEWLNYKENLRTKDKNSSTLRNLQDLKRSFLEGASIGSIISLINLINEIKLDHENGYIVDKDLLQTLVESNDIVQHQFEGIYEITQILEKNLELNEVKVNQFIEQLPLFSNKINPFLPDKNVTITYPKLTTNSIILLDTEMFSNAFEELIINAYKYCLSNSTIYVLAYISDGYLIITIKNDVSQNPYGGIPKDFEKIIIEPFIRLHNNLETMLKIERYGLGLGLTVVDNIIKKHNGIFFIHDIMDYTGKTNQTCVVAEVFIPIQK
jgi:CheY-like chemotaxis protein